MSEQTVDLHCLPFFLHLLEALLRCKIKLFYIVRTTMVAGLGVPIFRVFTVIVIQFRKDVFFSYCKDRTLYFCYII